MPTSFSVLIDDINLAIAIERANTGREYEFHGGPDLKARRRRYRKPLPLCCSEKDFDQWLCHNYGPQAPNFCWDCTPEHQAKMLKIGKCNRGGNVR